MVIDKELGETGVHFQFAVDEELSPLNNWRANVKRPDAVRDIFFLTLYNRHPRGEMTYEEFLANPDMRVQDFSMFNLETGVYDYWGDPSNMDRTLVLGRVPKNEKRYAGPELDLTGYRFVFVASDWSAQRAMSRTTYSHLPANRYPSPASYSRSSSEIYYDPNNKIVYLAWYGNIIGNNRRANYVTSALYHGLGKMGTRDSQWETFGSGIISPVDIVGGIGRRSDYVRMNPPEPNDRAIDFFAD